MKKKFKNAVDSGDLEDVRISLASEMMLDPRGESFNEMREYAENVLANLYEEHDGAVLDQNIVNWTEALLYSTRNALDRNFSKERLDYYSDVAKVVLKDKADKLNREKSNTPVTEHSSGDTGNCKLNTRQFSACLTIGGLLVGGSGLIMGKTIVTALGAVGAAIGAYQLYNDNKK